MRQRPTGKAVGDNAGLLEDLLEHEVAVATLLGGLHVPLDGHDLVAHGGEIFDGIDLVAPAVHSGHLPVLQEDDLAGVGQKGGNVGSHEEFARAYAHDEGSRHAGCQELAGLLAAHEADSVGALGQAQRLGEGLEQIGLVLAAFLHKIDQHLGVGFGAEGIALGLEIGLELEIVLDDAVVDDGESAVVALVRVGVAHGGLAVGGPARVPHACGGGGRATPAQLVLKGGKLALGADYLEVAALHGSDAG